MMGPVWAVCPKCGAKPLEPCRSPKGKRLPYSRFSHDARIRKAEGR